VPAVESAVADFTESAVDRAVEAADNVWAASRATAAGVVRAVGEEFPGAQRDAERVEDSLAGVIVDRQVVLPAAVAWRVGRRYLDQRRLRGAA
jgi:hypothetical protein